MADLPIKDSGVKQVQTERKPITLDKPQEVSQQIQIHLGNTDVLKIKLLESINNGIQKLVVALTEKKNG